MPESHPLARLFTYVQPHRVAITLSTTLRVINLGLGVVLLGLAGSHIASALLTGMYPGRSDWLLLGAVGVTKALARYGEQVIGHIAAFRILDTLRGRLFDGFASLDADRRAMERSGDIVTRLMSDIELVEVYFAHTLAPVAAAILFVIAACGASWVVGGPLAAVVIVACLVSAGALLPVAFQRAVSARGSEVRERAGRLGARITESLAGIQDLVATGSFEATAEIISEEGHALARDSARISRLAALKTALVDLLLVATLPTLALLGLASVRVSPELVWGSVAGLAGGLGAILSVNRAVDDLPKVVAAASRILEVIDPAILGTIHSAPPWLAAAVARPPTLIADAVSFEYVSGKGLHNVSFELAPGMHLFVTGSSGSGKSTLFALVVRLLHAQTGELRLGGIPIASIPDHELRTLISAAPQDAGLIRGTAMENVMIGARNGQLPDAAFDVTDLVSLFEALPDAERTIVGGADEQVSGGQQRRLALARMIARDPDIIVLDEAFSGLEAGLRAQLRDRTLAWARAGGKSILEFSHDLDDAGDADHVIVLADGAIAQQGSPEYVRGQDGPFRALVDAIDDQVQVPSRCGRRRRHRRRRPT
jgi:ATP-binding cassette, subfamily C, bacterial CydC